MSFISTPALTAQTHHVVAQEYLIAADRLSGMVGPELTMDENWPLTGNLLQAAALATLAQAHLAMAEVAPHEGDGVRDL